MCPVSCVLCPVSCVLCHVSCVPCLVSCVMCHVSCVMCAAYLPGEAGVWLPVHVARLGELLGVGVPWQLLEEEVVETVLVDEALDGDDVGLNTLDNAEG